MVGGNERPGARRGRRLNPGIAPWGGDREGRAPPVSVRCGERGVSRVAPLPPPQDLESADSTKVVTCEVFALLPPSDFPPRRPRRNSENVVIPFPRPISLKHGSQLNKVCFNGATTSEIRN